MVDELEVRRTGVNSKLNDEGKFIEICNGGYDELKFIEQVLLIRYI